MSDRLLDVLRDVPAICRHLHLPVQSGSSRVLSMMRRRYSRESYLALIDRARAAVPGLALSTDVIVGFPGETEAEFEETYSLVASVGFHAIYSFKYSPRPNTLALKRMTDDVPEAEKTRRIMRLQSLQRDVQARLYQEAIGGVEHVLVDAVSRRRDSELAGRTEGNTVINFPGPPDWIGRIVPVRVTDAAPNSLRGEYVDTQSREPVTC